MYVEVSAADPPTVTLHEWNDLASFAVVATGLTSAQLDAALIANGAGGVATSPPEHCWIRVDFVVAAAQPEADSGWPERFDGLLRYAARKGWLDESGSSILGHVVTGRPA